MTVPEHSNGAPDGKAPDLGNITFMALVRAGLFCFGLVLIGTGAATVLMPEYLYSDDPRPGLLIELLVALGAIGYGALLMISPRWLARSPSTRWGLTALVLVFACGIGLTASDSLHGFEVVTGVLARVWPAALALLLVELASRQPENRRHATKQTSGTTT
ncbi:MAG: hypothetical protein KDE27_23000 [Planctomycetes bacterium]|nr:hypothetical protein [Planctomycetota bacterium]